MKQAIAIFSLMAGIAGGSLAASAASMSMDGMKAMVECRAACNMEYMQCIGDANKLTSDPAMAIDQTKANFDASTSCGEAVMACKSACQ